MRVVKQIVYGLFFIGVTTGIGWFLYSATLKPPASCIDEKQNQGEAGVDCGGPCALCDISEAERLVVQDAQIFQHDRLYTVLIRIKNPNTTVGAESFDYRIELVDKDGAPLAELVNSSFMYAGEEKIIVEPGISVTTGVPAKANIQFNDSVVWKSSQEFNESRVEVVGIQSIQEQTRVVVRGVVKNTVNTSLSQAVVSVILVDTLGVRSSASRVILRNLEPFEEREFSVFVPVSAALRDSLNLEETEVIVAVVK